MARRPWFPFYVDDFEMSGRVRLMSSSERGCYVTLLAYQWREGSVPSEVRDLARLCNETPATMRKYWRRLESCFPITKDGKRRNIRMDTEREKADATSARQAAIARQRHAGGTRAASEREETGSEMVASPVSSTEVTSHKSQNRSTTAADSRLTSEGQEAFTGLCRAARNPEALAAEVRMILDGGRPNVPTDPAAVSLALHDLVVNGGQVTAAALRRFVQKAAEASRPDGRPETDYERQKRELAEWAAKP